MKAILATFAAFAAVLAVSAAEWTVYPTDQDGMTPSQQITNAVMQAASGDAIKFTSGTYQLDGASFMDIQTSGNATISSYVYLTDKSLTFIGESDGKWDDGVVLKGNGTERFFHVNYSGGASFRNLTFENFGANNNLSVVPTSGDESIYGIAGAGLFRGGFHAAHFVSNCVFRANTARYGGAIGNAYAMECLFTNNVANAKGGAVYGTRLVKCRLVDNKANGTAVGYGYGGAAYALQGASDTEFVSNQCYRNGGAVYSSYNGIVITNCVFCGNSVTGNSSSFGGGAMSLGACNGWRILDSIFDGNSASASPGGAFCPAGVVTDCVFDGCVFTNNTSRGYYGGKGGVAYIPSTSEILFGSCDFIGNSVSGNSEDIYAAVAFGGSFSNCTFSANTANMSGKGNGIVVGADGNLVEIADCTFSNNFNRIGGMVRYANITNTVFSGNEVPGDGGVIKRCNAVDCRFVGNRANSSAVAGQAYMPSGDATESTCVKCDMDLGCVVNSVLVDCRIHSLTNDGARYAFYGHNVATNCLIEGCRPSDQACGLIYRYDATIPALAYVEGSDYVNCTFADNVFPFILHHRNEYGIYTPFKNCLFYNNKNSSGKIIDAYYKVKDSHGDLSNLDSGFALSNCVVGASVESAIAGDTWHDLGGNVVVEPASVKIVGDQAEELGVNKYSLLTSSRVRGIGDASMFTASDLDYAGNLRLRDGLLDPGCFQCWLKIPGLTLIFR